MTIKDDIAALDSRVPYGVDHDLVLASLQSPGLPHADEAAVRRTARTTQATLDGVTSVDSVEAWAGEHTVSVAEPLTVGLPYDFRQSLTVTFNGELAAGGTGERMLMVVSLVDSEGEIISSAHPLAAGISGTWTHYAGGGFYMYAPLNTPAVMGFPAGSRAVEVTLYPWDGNDGLATVTSVSVSGQISTDAEYRGTGSPEGKVSAPVGSIYTDTAATNGAIRWVKTSGAGNTGWRVEYGDTGWRNISSLLSNGWGGNVYVRRINDSVELRVEGLTRSETSNTIMTLPAGFLPGLVAGHGLRFNLQQADPTASQTRFRIVSNIFSTFDSPTVPGPYYGGYTWTGSETWPTTLPGTPA